MRILIAILLGVSLCNSQVVISRRTAAAAAAPTPDAVNAAENTSGATLVYTINPTATAMVFVAVTTYGSHNVDNIDVKGTAASLVDRWTAGVDRLELWVAEGIASGSGNITITKGDASDEVASCALAVLGADTIGAPSDSNATSAEPITVTASATNQLIVACANYYNLTLSAGTGETIRIANENGAAQESVTILTEAGATSTTTNPHLSDSGGWMIIAVPVKP